MERHALRCGGHQPHGATGYSERSRLTPGAPSAKNTQGSEDLMQTGKVTRLGTMSLCRRSVQMITFWTYGVK